jgi:hypothetical protein
LNPTNNVTTKKPPPSGGLLYKNDSSRPGGGVFIARGKAKGAYPEVAPGVIIDGHSDDEDEGEVMSMLSKEDRLTRGADGAPAGGAHDDESGTQSPPGQERNGNGNVNPVLNDSGMPESENIHVMNTLNSAPPSRQALEEFALADNNWLDGIPGGMFDWGTWSEPRC